MAGTVAFDVETELITDTDLTPRLVCLSVPGALYHHTQSEPIAARLLEGAVVGVNVAFDMGVLWRAFPSLGPAIWAAYEEGRVFDVAIRAQLLDIAAGTFKFNPELEERPKYSLADMARRFLQRHVQKEDTWRLRYGELRDLPIERWPEAAVDYALIDAEVTQALWDRLPQPADEAPQVRAAWALHLMSVAGIAVDRGAVESLKIDLNNRSASFMRRITEAADKALNEGHDRALYRWQGPKKEPRRKLTRNDKEVRRRVRLELGIGAPRTDTGLISTSEDTLRMCTNQPDLLALADNIGTAKVQSAFVPYLLKAAEKGSVHPRFNVLVSSGRTSCAKPNLQQLPREGGVRQCFIAHPGHVLVSCDYSGAEVATLAQILLWRFGQSKMAEALQAGRDLHIDFAAQLLNVPYEEANTRYQQGDRDVKKARQFAKVFNFGAPGGLGAANLVQYARRNYGLEMSEQTAKKYKLVWLNAYPEMRRYFSHISEVADGLRKITQYVSGRVRGGIGYCDGANGYFQGLAADMFKAGLWRATWECYIDRSSPLFGSKPLVGVHDEIILEVPTAIGHEAALRLSEVMVREGKRYVPDIPLAAEPCLMHRWDKDAGPVYEGGRLIPWLPTSPDQARGAA